MESNVSIVPYVVMPLFAVWWESDPLHFQVVELARTPPSPQPANPTIPHVLQAQALVEVVQLLDVEPSEAQGGVLVDNLSVSGLQPSVCLRGCVETRFSACPNIPLWVPTCTEIALPCVNIPVLYGVNMSPPVPACKALNQHANARLPQHVSAMR